MPLLETTSIVFPPWYWQLSHFNTHTDPIFKEHGILKFNDIHSLQLGQFMYSCKKIHSHPQGLITNSPKAINSTLTIQKIPRPTVYRIVEQTLRRSRLFSTLTSFKNILKIKLLSKYENRS